MSFVIWKSVSFWTSITAMGVVQVKTCGMQLQLTWHGSKIPRLEEKILNKVILNQLYSMLLL